MITDVLGKLPPGTILILGALLLPAFKGNVKKAYYLILPVLSFIHLMMIPDGKPWTIEMFGMELTPIYKDALAMVWGYVFHIAALLSGIYSLHLDDDTQNVSGMTYAGAAIAAAFAGDLATLFLFWELTAITSVFLIWSNKDHKSRRAGVRYLIIQVLSGVLLLGGMVIQVAYEDTLDFKAMTLNLNDLGNVENFGVFLIFIAFGIKAAFPFLHTWLKNSYPRGTVTGTVFLSAFTTKLAIYALARGFAGTEVLITIGAIMTVFPIFFAVIENDLRRVLSYSLNNQLGFMVVGIGIGTELALNGASAHAFAHIIYKGLLFMAMGAVLHRTGTMKASELGGLYKSMPLTAVFCIIGSLSISGFPLFSGFVTKAMTISAVGYDMNLTWIYLALLLASAGVVDHSGIKIPFFSFFFHDNGWRVKEAPTNMLVAMGIAAALCIGIGVFPGPLYSILPYPEVAFDYQKKVYAAGHIIGSLQLLLFAALAFVLMMRTKNRIFAYPPEIPSINLDFGWFYRKFFPALLKPAGRRINSGYGGFTEGIIALGKKLHKILHHFYSPGGIMGEPWSTGRTTFWAALLLGMYLLLNYLH